MALCASVVSSSLEEAVSGDVPDAGACMLQSAKTRRAKSPPSVTLDFSDPMSWAENPGAVAGEKERSILRSENHWIVTVSSHGESMPAKFMAFPSIFVRAGPAWPGNHFKLLAFKEVARLLEPSALLLAVDETDVFLLSDPFQVFQEKVAQEPSMEILFSVERDYGMLSPEWGGFPTGKTREKSVPLSVFPANPMEEKIGVGRQCQGTACLQSRFPNSGILIGKAAALQSFFEDTWHSCSACKNAPQTGGDVMSNWPVSDQNIVSDQIIKSNWCGGHCFLDYDFSLGLTNPADGPEGYALTSDGTLFVTIAGTNISQPVRASALHFPDMADLAVRQAACKSLRMLKLEWQHEDCQNLTLLENDFNVQEGV